MVLIHYLEGRGVSDSTFRSELGFTTEWSSAIGREEVVDLLPRVIDAAQRLAGDGLVCLHAGEHFHPCLVGAGGLAATYAPTPAMALEAFGRFVGSDGFVRVETSTDEGETTFTVRVLEGWPPSIREQIIDALFAGVAAMLRAVGGDSCAPVEFRFTRADPSCSPEIERTLRERLAFDRPRDEFVVSTAELAKPSLLYDPMLCEQLTYIAELSSEKPRGTGPMRQLVEQSIRVGASSIEQVAETLQINKRTIQRRLQGEGASFRAIFIHVRVRQAERLLTESDSTIAEIAERLGYSDDKTFRKAIKSATGMTPTEIRDGVGRSSH